VVSNPAAAGSSTATGVVLTDQLPGNGGLVWQTATTSQGSCQPITGNLLTCQLGTIPPQGSVTVTVLSTATTPQAACQCQPNQQAKATATGNLSASDYGNLTCTPGPISASCVVIDAVQGVKITPVTMTASGGTGGYSFTATGLPSGLTISSAGTISGTPTVSGSFPYTVTVKDSSGNTGTVNCSVTVTTPPISSNCVAINAIKGVAITPVTMTASGGTGSGYTFSATGLPAGLSMATNGTISGTPTVTGTFSYTVTVTDSAGNKGSAYCTVTVNPPVSATCMSINAVQNVAILPVTMTASGGTGIGYIFTATGLPAGLTMSSTGTISGTPTVTGIFSYTLTVTDSAGNKGTACCTVTVKPPVSATCVSINAVQNVAIVPVTMTASGGTGSGYTFSATGLPTGLTISSTGTISGTPTVTGTFNYTVTVKDSAGNTGTVNCSVPVLPPVSATCVVINAVKGVAITPVTMTASGGTGTGFTFSATGLPPGLTISSSGTISGTPTATGTFPYTVTIKDSAGNTGTVNCSVPVVPPISATCVVINAVKGVAITPVTMTASGGTGTGYTFSATGLPPGLTISSGGTISGTPTTTGTFNYTVTITDSAGNTGTVNCSVAVLPPISATCVVINAIKGLPITPVTMTASGGTGTGYTFSATGLPTGLTMTSSGTIFGTPMVTGTFNYKVTITDSAGNVGTVNCSVPVLPPISTTCVVINAVQNLPITPVTMTASGGTGTGYTFSATGLPAGLTMSVTGTISGTPTVTGSFNYTVIIKDSAGNTVSAYCSVTVNPPIGATCVSITATQNVPITPVTMTATGGTGTGYSFSATGLPAGLTMSSTGTISGTPTVSGTFPYTVTVTDSAGNKGTVNCSVTVSTPPCTINGVTISNTSWNSFNIPAGTSPVVWTHAHIGTPSGVPTTGKTTVLFTGVTLTLNGTTYHLPNGLITFDPAAPATISTTFNAGLNRWETVVRPTSLSDEIFFTGAAIPVTPDIAGGAKATLTYSVVSQAPTVAFPWQWSAAVYTYWPADWNQAKIQPYHSSYHAGTPLNTTVQQSLIQGPRGGGGSNFTGSWSATGTGSCPK
jgi:hypothetical protein